MKASKLLITLIKGDLFKELFRLGIISSKVFDHFERYTFVENKKNSQNCNTAFAVELAAKYYKVSERTIYRSLKFFNIILK